MINFFKSFFNICEIYFTVLMWLLIFFIQLIFSWFFIEDINEYTYLYPCFLFIIIYVSYAFSGKYIAFQQVGLKKKINVLWPSLIAFTTVCLKLLDYLGNLSKDLSTIRDDRMNVTANFKDTLYIFLFFLLIFAFIVVNFNNLKYKTIINFLAFLSCLAFIPINGGRVNFLLFGALYICIYFFKNFKEIKKDIFKRFFYLTISVILISTIMTLFSTLRTGRDDIEIINYLNSMQYIDSKAITILSKYSFGIYLIIFISTFYDYTGSNIYHLSIFLENLPKLDHLAYGNYQFNFLIRFSFIDFRKIHDSIDSIYTNYDVNHNIWATSFRETITDFGIAGSFLYILFLSVILFKSRKYITISYSAQILYFMTFSFFIFSPFHSIFYISPAYGFAYFVAIILFFLKNVVKVKFTV